MRTFSREIVPVEIIVIGILCNVIINLKLQDNVEEKYK